MKRRDFLARAGTASAGLGLGASAAAKGGGYQPSVLVAWNGAVTSAIATNSFAPTTAARALSMVYEATFNAWACYDPYTRFTLASQSKRPSSEWKTSNKTIAIDHAAYTVLVDLFPGQRALFDQTLATTTTGLNLSSADGSAAVQVGQRAGTALLQSRYNDGSNQLGDLAPGAYADYTGYVAVNTPDLVVDPTRWQPLRVTNAAGVTSVQKFLTPQWGLVRPFALASGSVFRPAYTAGPTAAEMDQLIAFSAGLNDQTKTLVDFFANNPGSVTPPGQWTKIAEMVAANDGNSLDVDVWMFFALGQAMLDASIACWDAKRVYDTVRPVTAIRYYYAGRTIQSWGGPGNGTQTMPGENWKPYQRTTSPSPAFPEFVSGHSTFSAAAAAVLGMRGDKIDLSFTFPAGGVPFDPGVPAAPVTLRWKTLSETAAAAGLSRRYGGIHFEQGDLKGRALGQQVGYAVVARMASLYQD